MSAFGFDPQALIDKVAEALRKYEHPDSEPWDKASITAKEDYRKMAQVAMNALFSFKDYNLNMRVGESVRRGEEELANGGGTPLEDL
jgi:hypothetical protein